MWKYSKLFNCKWLFMHIIAFSIGLNEAAQCTDCPTTKLGTESKSITYGPSDKYNCWCDWTIPRSMATAHETAVVLLLQNVSLPMTSGSGNIYCSGEIRFPSTDGYKCRFPTNYCLVFATTSTICNISKVRKKISVANHTCDSIIPWNYAGGSPYKIEYYAKNYAGYTKYITIQYLIVDCIPTTTPMLPTASEQETTTERAADTKHTLIVKQYSDTTTKSTRTTDNIQCPSECNENSKRSSSQASLIIAIPVSGIMGFIIGVLLTLTILRYCNNKKKKVKNKDSMEIGSIQHQQPTVHERTTYENCTPTSDESGYEIPIQVDNKNEQQYEVIKSGKEYQYDN